MLCNLICSRSDVATRDLQNGRKRLNDVQRFLGVQDIQNLRPVIKEDQANRLHSSPKVSVPYCSHGSKIQRSYVSVSGESAKSLFTNFGSASASKSNGSPYLSSVKLRDASGKAAIRVNHGNRARTASNNVTIGKLPTIA